VLAVIVLVLAAAGYGYVRYRYDQIHKVAVRGLAHSGAATSDTPMTILLVGDNCRSCLNGAQAGAFGTGAQVGGGRSDVTMLLHLDPATRQVSVLSIPRDLFLPIPGTTKENRVDSALNFGPAELVATIEDDLGIPIDHYVELNFDTFQSVVNALGGIDMYFPDPVRDSYSGLNVTTTGCVHLNGFQALAVVRARHMYYEQDGVWKYDGLGDISRIQRDHEFLKVLAAQVYSQGIGNPLTANAVLGNVVGDLTIDSGLSESTLASLVLDYRHVDAAKVPTQTLPVDIDPNSYYFNGADYGDVVFPESVPDRAAIEAFLGLRSPPASYVRPGSVRVDVLDGSATPGQGAQVATALASLGFRATSVGSTPPAANPAETVVYYPAGLQAQALRLADALGGSVALGLGGPASAGTLTLVTGDGLSVTNAPASHPATSPAPASSPAAAPTAAPTAAPIGGGYVIPAHSAYPAYDPRACPSGAGA
jgi:LCP family protein required for cell wall assembly